jgi:hypothetical protein
MRRSLLVLLAGLVCLVPCPVRGQTPAVALPQLPPPSRMTPALQTPPPFGSLPAGPAQPGVTPAPRTAAPDPTSQPVGKLLSFDPEQTEVQWQNDRWELVAGGTLLKDFGRREADAREALRVVRALHLNQTGQVGSPRPILEYWLSDGRAPQGSVAGLHTINLDPANLTAEQIRGQWCVRDNARILFTFGTHEGEARQALALLRRYRFTQLGYVGRGAPSMLVLLGNPAAAMAPQPLQGPAPLASRTLSPDQAVKPASSGHVQQASFSSSEPVAAAGQPAGDRGLKSIAAAPPFSNRWQLATPAMPLPGEEAAVERVPFEWRLVQVRKDGADWKLTSGTYVLANFGRQERDAYLALSALQACRVNEHCLIGSPQPCFSYFLAGGQAPHGQVFGTANATFQPDKLAVRSTRDGWAICEGDRTLFPFGDHGREARQALKEIQRYRFDTVCRVGRGDGPALTLLTRSRY